MPVDINSRKLKVVLIVFWIGTDRNGHGYLGHWTRKSAVSQEWVDQLSWFFTWWYEFRKAYSYFDNFTLGLVKIEVAF